MSWSGTTSPWSFVHQVCCMDDSLLWWVLRHSQIGSGWSRASFSAVLVSRIITLGAWGGWGGVSSCCFILPSSRFRHLSDFPITPSLHSSKGDWRSAVFTGMCGGCRDLKGHSLLAKNMFYANSHEVPPVDTGLDVMGHYMAHYDHLHILFCHRYSGAVLQTWRSSSQGVCPHLSVTVSDGCSRNARCWERSILIIYV